MKIYTASELNGIAESAFNYLRKYFYQDVGRHNYVIVRGDLPDNTLISSNIYGNKKVYVDMINIDESKLIRKLKKGKFNFEDKFSTALDEIIGGEIGYILFYAVHEPNHLKLKPAQEVTGHYSGMIYANRDNHEPLFLRPYRNEENYERARKLYTKFKDTKLAELTMIKTLTDFNDLVTKLEV